MPAPHATRAPGSTTRPGRRRPGTVPVALATLLLFSACTGDDGDGASASKPSGVVAATGTVPEDAKRIMEKAPYKTARWIYYVADAETGDVLLANRPDEMVSTASTAKGFVVGAVHDRLGSGRTLTTPVFSTTPVAGGAVTGDVVLVGSGDLFLGGRNSLEGKADHAFSRTAIDHIYGDVAPIAKRIGDPLAGLDDLARQVAGKGVTRIDGNVVIDTRLWETFEGGEGASPPIWVNDNILDVQVNATAQGQPATIEVTPQSSYFTVRSEVTTVAGDGETELEITDSPDDPSTLLVRGSIAANHSQLAIYRIENAAEWARTLFIEALERAGVSVAAPARGPNDESRLPATGSYPAGQELASLESVPLSAMGTMILETSYNRGANGFLCLLAVERGSTDCTEGLKTIYELAEKAGVQTDDLILLDGQGAEPDSTTPRQITRWMQWAREQPWGEVFVKSQPVLGRTGSLAASAVDNPAAGKVAAKTGTSVNVDLVTGRLYVTVQSMTGYLTLESGKVLVFGLSMSGATFPNVQEGIVQITDDVGAVAAAFQQELSR